MEIQTMFPIITQTCMTTVGWASAMTQTIPEIGLCNRIVLLSTIIGKAASTGRMKTMMDMMTVMTDFGTKGSFDSVFSYSVFQLFLGTVKKHCQKKIMKDLC